MPTSYMLPIPKIKEGINKGIQEDRARATHGDTSLNAFFIDELGKVYPWRRRGDLPLGHDAFFDDSGYHKRFNPGAVMVHSHAAENWAHFEKMTGAMEPMTSFSISDIQFLQGMVRKNTGNTLALIHGDGRLDLLRVPEAAADGFLGLNEKNIALQASPPEDWWKSRKREFETWADVQRRVVSDFAKNHKLVLKEGLRWKPKGKVVEPLIKKRSYYPHPKHAWYESIWEETSRPTPGTTATTKPYWMIVPGAAWPAEAKQMQLWRERPGGRARQTYKRVPWTEAKRPWEEAQQMRFFGTLGRILKRDVYERFPDREADIKRLAAKGVPYWEIYAMLDAEAKLTRRGYVKCARCGEMIRKEHAYPVGNALVCRICAEEMEAGRVAPYGRGMRELPPKPGAPQQMRLFGYPRAVGFAGPEFGQEVKMKGRRIKYNKADINAAINAAITLDLNVPAYILATYYGYTITYDDPKGLSQSHIVVKPGGHVEERIYNYRQEKWETRELTRGLGAAPPFRLTRQAWQPSFQLPRPGKTKPTAAEIKQSMARHRARVKPKIRKADLTPDEKKAIDAIGEGSVHIDDIGKKSGLPPYKVSAALVMLELKGLVQQTAGKRFNTKKQPSASVLSGNGKQGPLTAKELRESGFSEEAIKMMLERQRVGTRLRKLQDQLIRSLMAKHGKRADVEDMPVEAGLPSIAQLRAYVFPQHEEAFTWLLKRLKRKGGFEGVFQGRIAHCGIWDRDRYTGNLICRDYFTACQTTDRCLAIPEKPKTQTRVCTKFKDVASITTAKGYVSRCAHYEALCRPVGCITSAAPHPELRGELDPKQIRAVAEWMAEEHEEKKGVDPKWLAREIASRGGIRAYKKQYPGQKTDPEFMAIPLFMKKKSGLPPDEMADEMGYSTDTELYRDIHRAYPPKTAKTALQKRIERQKKTWRDFEEGAVNYLLEQAGAGTYT